MVAIIWGVLRLRIVRSSVPNKVLREEASWTMGQVMPLVLIGLPLMIACEYFFERTYACSYPLLAHSDLEQCRT